MSWARERGGWGPVDFARKCRISEEQLQKWESGESSLTFRQAQHFAKVARIPFGYLYLKDIPVQKTLPIPDLRTLDSLELAEPSAELSELLDLMLECQAWYRDYAIQQELEPVSVVGSFSVHDGVGAVVRDVRQKLNISPYPQKGSWEDYYRDLVQRIESLGILVMRQAFLNHHSRRFKVEEFRGFALSDPYAPMIFINDADAPGARLFTLMHELSHLWIDSSGVSDGHIGSHRQDEKFCNEVAAAVLVPEDEFRQQWKTDFENWRQNLPILESHFHVSSWVLARRACTLGYINPLEYGSYIQEQKRAYENREPTSGGPSFYRLKKSRISPLFSRAVIHQALNGNLLFRDAGWFLGVKPSGILKFARELGFAISP